MKLRSAFTLIEVVVVIVVLAILSGVAVVKYLDYSTNAKASAEAAVVGSVRSGLAQTYANSAANGNAAWPATLDSAASGATASASAPFFGSVLDTPIVGGWSKGSNTLTYVSPSGVSYVYDPTRGTFGSASAASGGSGGTPASSNTPAYRNSSTYIAGSDPLGPVGSGYTEGSNGVLDLTDSSPNFNEAARRVAVIGQQAISAGNYAITLDTKLTDYWTQLNYWEVIGLRNGTAISLSGNTLNWGASQNGMGVLYQDYAPPAKSDGTWYSYNTTFTVSAAQASQYDQIMVIVAGSRNSSQSLGWRNVTLTKVP